MQHIMQYISTIFLIILITKSMSYSQLVDAGYNYPNQVHVTKQLSIIDDFDKDGKLESLNADLIKKLGKNLYWIQKAQLFNADNQIMLDMGIYLKSGDKQVINQVPAYNGYIIEMVGSENDWRNMLIWLANEKGEKDSDFISLEFNKSYTILY